jgi:hypothetical protein
MGTTERCFICLSTDTSFRRFYRDQSRDDRACKGWERELLAQRRVRAKGEEEEAP